MKILSTLENSGIEGKLDEINQTLGGIAAPAADRVEYDNAESGMTAENVQDAIDELREQNNDLDALVGLGGIAESGSNANGNYIRFADGTQICYQTVNLTIINTTGESDQVYTFPAVFIENPRSTITLSDIRSTTINAGNVGKIGMWGESLPSTTGGRIRIYPVSGMTLMTGATIPFTIVTVGRWK